MTTAIVNRGALLSVLESVRPGVSAREVLEQSSCFAFDAGKVSSFNDEVYCQAASGMPGDFRGAVLAKPLAAILSKLSDEELTVEWTAGELLFGGKRRKVGMRLSELVATDAVKAPSDWRPLHPDFNSAVEHVQGCAGTDESKFALTCVHVTPRWVEAMDNAHLARYRLKTGFASKTLLRKEPLRHVAAMDMTEVAEGEEWVHFRNPTGLVVACRRYTEDYEDLTPFLEVADGVATTLPQGLSEAAARAEVFSAENAGDNLLLVEVRNGRISVKGLGTSGWYEESKKVKYTGPDLKFTVPPKMLASALERHADCVLGNNRLKIDGGRWTYVTCLGGE